jgi:hypothetical protein
MHSPLEAARRSRPKRTTEVLGEQYLIRRPSMATVRNFQARSNEDSRGAMLEFLQECVAGESGEFDLTTDQAGELADMQWVSGPLLGKIIRFGNGLTDEPLPGEDAEPEESEAPKA